MTFATSLRTGAGFKPIAITTPPPSIAPSKHFAALDGIRGIAILMVLALHFTVLLGGTRWEWRLIAAAQPGYLGVTLFFVLSGFLITRILVLTRDKRDYFTTFYLRRAPRIFPLYYAYIAFMLLGFFPLERWFNGTQTRPNAHPLVYLFYISNLHWHFDQSPLLGHMWSLAIEEQFYLVWPLVIFLAPHRSLLPLCIVGFCATLGYRIGMEMQHCATSHIYSTTLSRIDALLLGGAVGLIELNAVSRQRLIRAVWPIMIVSLLGTMTFLVRYRMSMTLTPVRTLGWSVVTIFFAALVFWAATSGSTNRLLNTRWLRGLGKYSYGVYILHTLPLDVLPRWMPHETGAQRVLMFAASVAATAGLTAFSWHFIELPFLRKKQQLTAAA